MKVRTRLVALGALALLLAGFALAQGVGPRPGLGQGGDWSARRLNRLARYLNLTESQKIAAQAIFTDARNAITPLLPASRQAQQALRDAEKTATSEQQLQALLALAGKAAQAMAPIMGVRAQAQAKFYALLTQDQKDKLGTLRGLMRPGVGARVRQSRPRADD